VLFRSMVQTGTILTRAASTTTTGGLGNPLVATAELGLAIFTSILALVVPVLAALLVVVLAVVIARKAWRWFRPAAPAVAAS